LGIRRKSVWELNKERKKMAMSAEFYQKFLKDSDHTGRHFVVSMRTGKKYGIEPIDGKEKRKWGDVNPASGKVEGSYGSKYKGSIKASESLINEDNGFKNIIELEPGMSPAAQIELMDAEYPSLESYCGA